MFLELASKCANPVFQFTRVGTTLGTPTLTRVNRGPRSVSHNSYPKHCCVDYPNQKVE